MLKPVNVPALSLFALQCKPLHGVRIQHINGLVEHAPVAFGIDRFGGCNCRKPDIETVVYVMRIIRRQTQAGAKDSGRFR